MGGALDEAKVESNFITFTDAYKVARNCNGEDFCLEVPVDQVSISNLLHGNARLHVERQLTLYYKSNLLLILILFTTD